MKSHIQRAVLVALALLPTIVAAASSARSEYASVLKAKPDPESGEMLFGQCMSCHGVGGAGEANGSTPRIAGQHFRVIARQIVDFRYGKRWDFRMEGMVDRHKLMNAQEIADVAAYVSKLTQPGIRGIGNGELLAQGESIYARQCQSCHGAGAEGDNESGVPRLAGQHYAYLVRQMFDAVDGRRPALPALHSKRIEPLDYDQVRAVADFLSRVGWQASEKSPSAAPEVSPAP